MCSAYSTAIPLQAWTGLEGSRRLRGSQISRQSAHEGGKVIRLTHRPPLLPRQHFWYSFLLETESTPDHSAAGRFMSIKNSNDHRESKPRPPGFKSNASTNWATAYPNVFRMIFTIAITLNQLAFLGKKMRVL